MKMSPVFLSIVVMIVTRHDYSLRKNGLAALQGQIQVVQELQQVLVLGESLEALEVKADILDVQDILVDVKWIA